MNPINPKIWIDLDNSPHVPFFYPIIKELEKFEFQLIVTARNRFQVCDLADQYGLTYKRIGRYYGKNKVVKLFWLTFRALQLYPIVKQEKPRLALSHGSRSQILLTKVLGIPSVVIFDYEYTKNIPFILPNWLICPKIISLKNINNGKAKLLTYNGIKEDVYIPYFKPKNSIKDELGLDENKLIITIRPPAMEAHYFCKESEKLFNSTMNFLCGLNNVKLILLPRNEKQKTTIYKNWEQWTSMGKIVIPDRTVDGLNLLWYSDLVISGGGTMNREAAALGVPVYSIFRGKIGAVDRYLSENGRLVLIENEEDIYKKIKLAKRDKSINNIRKNNEALKTIVSHIIHILESSNP